MGINVDDIFKELVTEEEADEIINNIKNEYTAKHPDKKLLIEQVAIILKQNWLDIGIVKK